MRRSLLKEKVDARQLVELKIIINNNLRNLKCKVSNYMFILNSIYPQIHLQRGKGVAFLAHGFICRAQANAFHISGSHSLISEKEDKNNTMYSVIPLWFISYISYLPLHVV